MHAIDSSNDHRMPSVSSVALCLCGSGYRAALFHLGSLRRWNELGLLATVKSIHAVGGGGLVAGVMAARWNDLGCGLRGELLHFESIVARPIRRLVCRPLSLRPTTRTRLRPRNWRKLASGEFTDTDRFTEILDDRLFSGRLLADISAFAPEFTWCATNLRTGGRWELSRNEVGEPMLGFRDPGRMRISEAVASSMVSPATMHPVVIQSPPGMFEGGEVDTRIYSLRASALLVDGSIHDPLAMETAWNRASTILVSDGGSGLSPVTDFDDWPGNRLYRTMEIQNHRAVEARRRWLIEMIRTGRIEGTYASLAAQHRDYGLLDSVGYSEACVGRIHAIPKELHCFRADEMALLVNHGYSIGDVAARRLLGHRIRNDVAFRLPCADIAIDEPTLKIADYRSEGLRRAAA